MRALLLCLFFWFLTTWLETVLFSSSNWFQPNLFFLTPTILCLHRRGSQTHFMFLLFGLTADSFSTLPFGLFGLTFFIMSFFVRRIAETASLVISVLHAPIVSAAAVLLLNILTLLILFVWFADETFAWEWMTGLLLHEMFPTAVMSVPAYQLITAIEQKYQVKPGEKLF